MSRSLIEYLEHILTEAEFLVSVSENLSLDKLLADELRKRAIVRSLEIIGEAAKKVNDETRLTYPEVEWRAFAGMRDILIFLFISISVSITKLFGRQYRTKYLNSLSKSSESLPI